MFFAACAASGKHSAASNKIFEDKEFMTAIVRAVDLTKQVLSGDQPLTILHEASFTVDAGDSLAILGASGSGKTTLLGLLAGLDSPSSGTVYLDGTDIFSFDEDGRAQLRGRLSGFVFQSFQLLPALTALENVMLPLELHGAPDARERATDRARVRGPAENIVRRRTDRQPRRRDRQPDHRADAGAEPRAGHHADPGHPRRGTGAALQSAAASGGWAGGIMILPNCR
jgi:ABC-type glutathione transport system ATPase component